MELYQPARNRFRRENRAIRFYRRPSFAVENRSGIEQQDRAIQNATGAKNSIKKLPLKPSRKSRLPKVKLWQTKCLHGASQKSSFNGDSWKFWINIRTALIRKSWEAMP
jgi:hypothetical protein